MGWRPKPVSRDFSQIGSIISDIPSPFATTLKTIGGGLVDLGSKKIHKKQEEQEEQAKKNLTRLTNIVLNPDESNKLFATLGEKNANEALGLIDLGDKRAKSFSFSYKNSDGKRVAVRPSGEEVVFGKEFSAPKYDTYIDEKHQKILYNQNNPNHKRVIGKVPNQSTHKGANGEKRYPNRVYLGSTTPELRRLAGELDVPIEVERIGKGRDQIRRYIDGDKIKKALRAKKGDSGGR